MRFAPTLRRFWPCLLLGWLTVANAADSPSKDDELYAEIRRFDETLSARKLPKPTPEVMTEYDLMEEMSVGALRVDPAFCERIGLEALSDRLQPILDAPFPRMLDKERSRLRESIVVSRIFLLRAQLLCQQGKVAEGQAWMLKLHRMARRADGDQNMLTQMLAFAYEHLGLQAAAYHVETWPEKDRLAYVSSLEQLGPLARLDLAIRKDNASCGPKHSVPALMEELKPLTPAQRKERLQKIFKTIVGEDDEQAYLRRLQTMLENLTPESWETILDSVSAELQPLTPERLQAFQTRNAEALTQVQADEAKSAGQTFASPARRAEALYRVLLARHFTLVARKGLDTELTLQLLKQVLLRGADFGEKDLAGLTDASGNPLHLGKSEDGNRKAIKIGSTIDSFLILGPIK